jgi:hypothetical protein
MKKPPGHPLPAEYLERMSDVEIHSLANAAMQRNAIDQQQWARYFGYVHRRREERAARGFPRKPPGPEAT